MISSKLESLRCFRVGCRTENLQRASVIWFYCCCMQMAINLVCCGGTNEVQALTLWYYLFSRKLCSIIYFLESSAQTLTELAVWDVCISSPCFFKKDNKFLYAVICAMILNVVASKMLHMLLFAMCHWHCVKKTIGVLEYCRRLFLQLGFWHVRDSCMCLAS